MPKKSGARKAGVNQSDSSGVALLFVPGGAAFRGSRDVPGVEGRSVTDSGIKVGAAIRVQHEQLLLLFVVLSFRRIFGSRLGNQNNYYYSFPPLSYVFCKLKIELNKFICYF